MKVLDLFSGIGGFSIGLHRAGFETVAFAETDPYASRVLAKRFPNVPNLGDVQTAEYPDADFICAGFPCQDISFAGAGAGLAGERSGLWREVVRALRVVRPRGALLENVAALLGRGLDTVLGDLAEVGYDAEWHCIPASAVGAPHRRDRIWIYCAPDSPPVLGASIFGRQSNGDYAGPGEVANADSEGLEGRNGEELSECAGERTAGPSSSLPDTDSESEHDGALDAEVGGSPEPVADAEGDGRRQGHQNDSRRSQRGSAGQRSGPERGGGWWSSEPDVGRVAHGIPSRVDRLRCLGNAVVPQIPELIGRAILASLEQERIAA
jgi:DNA (cytosine-5)-methyltransferase 1